MIAFIITLIIIGQVLLFIELAVIPGLGIAGILGLGTIVGSCYLSFTQISVSAGIASIIVNIILAIIITTLTLRGKTWKKYSLKTNIESKVDSSAKDKGVAIGSIGTTVTRLAPSGTATIDGITLEVTTRGSLVNAQTQVEVTEILGNKVFVKEV